MNDIKEYIAKKADGYARNVKYHERLVRLNQRLEEEMEILLRKIQQLEESQ